MCWSSASSDFGAAREIALINRRMALYTMLAHKKPRSVEARDFHLGLGRNLGIGKIAGDFARAIIRGRQTRGAVSQAAARGQENRTVESLLRAAIVAGSAAPHASKNCNNCL